MQVEIAQKLLHQGLKRPELKDELYMQVHSNYICSLSPSLSQGQEKSQTNQDYVAILAI